MKKIVVLCDSSEKFTGLFPEKSEYIVEYSKSADVMPDTDCVLISQEFIGDRLTETAASLSSRSIAFGVLTFDKSEENEEYLLDCGAGNIFGIPMSPVILEKRIAVLTETSDRRGAADPGLELFSQLAAADQKCGAYSVPESVFPDVYKLVLRLQERMDKPAQLVKFSFHTRLGGPLEPGILEEAFPIVQKCLRRGDIVSIFGQCLFAILMGADSEGGRVAADRIISTYNAHFCDNIYDMRYIMNVIK